MAANWQFDDFVQKTLARFTDSLREEMEARLHMAAHVALTRVGLESPLEAAFLAAWEMYEQLRDNGHCNVRFGLVSQVEVPPYRLDFKVRPTHNSAPEYLSRFPNICIELDGHEFHEKTKEQVARRNERDRFLVTRGWRVVRFSGSEFYRDPFACVHDAWRIADEAIGTLMLEDWNKEVEAQRG